MNDASNRAAGRILGNKVCITHTTHHTFSRVEQSSRLQPCPPLPSLILEHPLTPIISLSF
ncbi:hypothetical protein BDZ97DRAFT_1825709 [Flammula alnicola]|nr:hypothetical protein BDZ97DRAFT_1825709 [Flammula alnicola]